MRFQGPTDSSLTLWEGSPSPASGDAPYGLPYSVQTRANFAVLCHLRFGAETMCSLGGPHFQKHQAWHFQQSEQSLPIGLSQLGQEGTRPIFSSKEN